MIRFAVLTMILCSTTACAGAGSGSSGVSNRSQITADEIAASNASTAYELIERLRPEYLRTRGVSSIHNPTPERAVIYVDGMHVGPVDVLHSISARDVETVRYLSAADATTRYGTGHASGVIEIRTRNRQ